MRVNGINNSYKVQPIQRKGNVGCLSDENREKKEQNFNQNKKRDNEFTNLLKSKYDFKV